LEIQPVDTRISPPRVWLSLKLQAHITIRAHLNGLPTRALRLATTNMVIQSPVAVRDPEEHSPYYRQHNGLRCNDLGKDQLQRRHFRKRRMHIHRIFRLRNQPRGYQHHNRHHNHNQLPRLNRHRTPFPKAHAAVVRALGHKLPQHELAVIAGNRADQTVRPVMPKHRPDALPK
jgi:hypothetical protein